MAYVDRQTPGYGTGIDGYPTPPPPAGHTPPPAQAMSAPPAPGDQAPEPWEEEERPTGCCAGKERKRPMGRDFGYTRLIIPFERTECCGAGTGVDLAKVSTVPPPLAAKHVTQQEWSRVLELLGPAHSKDNCGVCFEMTVFFSTLCLCLGACCFLDCIYEYHRNVQAWQDQVNAEVLGPKGLFLKTKGWAWDEGGGQHRHRVELSWLEIGLTPEAVRQMQSEPYVEGSYCPCEKEKRVL